MIIWIIAFLITIIVLKLGKIGTTPARLAFGSLVITTVVALISVPIVFLLGHAELITDLSNVLSLVVASLLSVWFFVAKSKLSMVAICIYFAFGVVGSAIMISSYPLELWLGTAVGGVVAVVGLVSGIYCLCTWSTSVPNSVEPLAA